jgi:hypothetical protein
MPLCAGFVPGVRLGGHFEGRLAHRLGVVGARDDHRVRPGVASPGTLVSPSVDCDSVEAMNDENPEADIHSATSGDSSHGGVTVTAEPVDPDVGESEIPASTAPPPLSPHAARASRTTQAHTPSRTLEVYDARRRRSESNRRPTRMARRPVNAAALGKPYRNRSTGLNTSPTWTRRLNPHF